MKKQLFFIALLPGEPIASEVTRFKHYAADHFQSARALRSPPHITLIPPFWWAPADRGRLDGALAEFCRERPPFSIRLRGFDCFPPRVIFIAVRPNQALTKLQAALQDYLQKSLALPARDRRPFHPHLTVAFKDLRRAVFPEAWRYFSEQPYERSFEVEELILLRYREQAWKVAGRFSLTGEGELHPPN